MQTQPLFSVLVANYNNGKYIAECLDAILKQDYPNIELIVVDDASTDNSFAVINDFRHKFGNLKLLRNEQNKGVGYSKNRCINECSGEICGFVDSDDAITPDAVSKMVAAHQKNTAAALIYSNLYFCDTQLTVTGKKQGAQVPQNQLHFFNEDGHISHFATFKKAAYLKTTGIHPQLKRADDQDLYLKLYDVGEVIFLEEYLYYYRLHSGGVSSLNNENSAYFERWKIIFKRAEEKGIDIEPYFWQIFVRRASVKHMLKLYQMIRNSIFYKLYRKLVN